MTALSFTLALPKEFNMGLKVQKSKISSPKLSPTEITSPNARLNFIKMKNNNIASQHCTTKVKPNLMSRFINHYSKFEITMIVLLNCLALSLLVGAIISFLG